MLVLGIETTCDETAAAVVENGFHILSNIAASQSLHEKYGGVFPELASRRHIELILPIIEEALGKAAVPFNAIDLIAVAHAPGLIGPLLIGLNTAKALSLAYNIPFIGINHVEAHLYAAMMDKPNLFSHANSKALGAVLSGGHTFLTEILGNREYRLIGRTVDDALGEAFDKIAALLGLPYPGGPHVERLAQKGDPLRYSFRCGKVKRSPFDFSFSGLKTAVLYEIKKRNSPLSLVEKQDIAASFQRSAFQDVVKKILLAARTYSCEVVFLGGGVSQNQNLRELFKKEAPHLTLFWPPKELCTDNAAMIAGLGYQCFAQNPSPSPFTLAAVSKINFTQETDINYFS